MYITVNINQAGALRDQRYAFTDRFTLVSELLQNARRAGASRIEMIYDEAQQTLRVRDNGTGIQDFQTLLSLHESGWASDLRDAEQAFGVGFSQCLYRARHCRITSGRQCIDFDCDAALAQQPIEVLNLPEALDGTCVELDGVELPDWQVRIAQLCMGFPVPLHLNGQEVPRPLALAALKTQPTEIGEVFLLGRDDGCCTRQLLVFLQGFCVWHSPWGLNELANVVHLDPQQFLARLPDRDKLLDEDQQLARIHAVLERCWQQVLEERVTTLDAEQFLARYTYCVHRWKQQALLNHLDLLPEANYQVFRDYPVQSSNGLGEGLQAATHPLHRQQIERAAVQLVELAPLDELNAAVWMFARACNYRVCEHQALDEQHWVHPHVKVLETEALQVTVLQEQYRGWFESRWISAPVVLCAAVRLQIGNRMVDITDEGLCHDAVLYIPAGERSGQVVRQAMNYVDEHDYVHEDDAEADSVALAELIRHLRSRDPLHTLRALLSELQLDRYPALQGQRFAVSVGHQPSDLGLACLGVQGGDHAQP